MPRYINATLLKAEFTGNFTDTYSPPLIKTIIDGQPTADVVEVTRCKDCKFYEPYGKPCEDFDGRCFARECETDEYDFCNYGVMRKDTTSDAEIH